MAPTLDILRRIEANTPSLKFRFTEGAAGAGHYKERAVDKAYGGGIKPMEYGGKDGTNSIAKAVLAALG